MFKSIVRKELTLIPILILTIAFMGCGGGGGGTSGDGGSGSSGSPNIQVLPLSHDFGTVTTGNSPAPLVVEINNNGSAALNVSNIVLSDPNNAFELDLSGGSFPCGASSPTIAAGTTCTFEVGFVPATDANFEATIQISSNASATPISLQLTGISEPVKSLIVRINQVECNAAGDDTAYVSVTDQGGFPVSGLSKTDFSVSLNNGPGLPPSSVEFVEKAKTISIAAVMDYSRSITVTPGAVRDMENGLVEFFANLQTGDEGEIVKFASSLDVVQGFTEDKALLTTAILAPFNKGSDTVLYDAVTRAVEDTKIRGKDRKAVIVLTDGEDDGTGTLEYPDVIASAKGFLPIFTIGIGSSVNEKILDDMAFETGGLFFPALTSDNLRTIYQQLSDILFVDQYIITFPEANGELKISATSNGIEGSDTRQISCP